MNLKQLASAAEPARLGSYLARKAGAASGRGGHVHHGGAGGASESVREDHHEGHHIVIRTTYQITVDGKQLTTPIGVDNDGEVHCHALPNYQFTSAIDMVKRLISLFPEDFVASAPDGGGGGHHHHQAAVAAPLRRPAAKKPSKRAAKPAAKRPAGKPSARGRKGKRHGGH
jgi:hypothetical protein